MKDNNDSVSSEMVESANAIVPNRIEFNHDHHQSSDSLIPVVPPPAKFRRGLRSAVRDGHSRGLHPWPFLVKIW